VFLHRALSEEVYMVQLPGFVHPSFPSHVRKLAKPLYGLNQAPLAWFSHLSDKLLTLGFTASRVDPSLFVFKTSTLTMFNLIYVDDIIIIALNSNGIEDLLQQLGSVFVVKDLGSLSYFLGIEAINLKFGLLLSQHGYILDLLKHINMQEAKPIPLPMSLSHMLTTFKDDPVEDPSLF
jgi:hypothetical protein